ncbi:MAG: signal peptidase I, partial [Clostridia bacterium]|nr:signal peptidase I [Clostridia bacterium]
IGVAGEKISIKQDSDGYYKVFINDKAYDEKYIAHADDMYVCYTKFQRFLRNNNITTDYLILNDGEIFVLGDNRGDSKDSSEYGARKVNEIEGKVIFIIPQHYNFFKTKLVQ